MPDLTRLEGLVKTLDRNRTAYLSGKFNEAQVRVQFINPFFELLGCGVNNKQGYAESHKDVYHEDAVSIRGATKAHDYAFCIGGTRKFFLEAKKPSINIKGDPRLRFSTSALRLVGQTASQHSHRL